jgi:hypothetical protein
LPGERIIQAFDQTHTGTAQLFYHNHWRAFRAGSALRCCAMAAKPSSSTGSDSTLHLTELLESRFGALNRSRLDREFDITNVSNSIHKIAKESEEIPIQYAPPAP